MASQSSFYGNAISSLGKPLVGQSVAICSQPANTNTTPCSPLVTTFTDITGSTPTGTPGITTTDLLGNYHFYVPSGIYTIQVYGPQVSSPLVQKDVFISTGTSSDNTFTGNNTFSNLNNVFYVGGSITSWTGSDIGAQINSIYAQCSSPGVCHIIVIPPSSGNTYNFTTPIVATTNHKYLLLEGAGISGTPLAGQNSGIVLNYTPTSGNAITLDYSDTTGSATVDHGIRKITILNNGCITGAGCGGTANGVVIGNTNGGAGQASFDFLNLQGFGGTGFLNNNTNTNANWGFVFVHSFVANCATGMNLGASGEGMELYSTRFVNNGTHITATSGFKFFGGSLDGHSVAAVNLNWAGNTVPSVAQFTNVHWENSASGSNTAFITGNGNYQIMGGELVDDITVGTITSFFNAGGGSAIIGGGFQVSSVRTAMTQLIAASSPVRVHAEVILSGGIATVSPLNICTSGYANCTAWPVLSNNANTQPLWSFEPQFKVPFGIGDAPFTLNSAVGLQIRVNDNNFNALSIEGTNAARRMAMGYNMGGGANVFTFRDTTGAFNWFHLATDGGIRFPEIAAPTGLAANDVFWGDSTTHRLMVNNNNTGADFVGNNLVQGCGTTTTCSKSQVLKPITVIGGPIALIAGTITVTSLPFTSSTSYVCSPDDSTGINGIDVVYNSGSSVTFNGTGTDSIRYTCIGN